MVSLQHHDDPMLSQRVDRILDRILAAQQEDGFLISYFVVNGLDKKWDDMRLEHQMYNAGHFFEMAVEHQRLTGEKKAIDPEEILFVTKITFVNLGENGTKTAIK